MNRKAFTLLELLMVVIIIGILATFAIPEYAKFEEKGIATEAINMLGVIKRCKEYQERWPDVVADSEAWEYSEALHLATRTSLLIARREEGPYQGSFIRMKIPVDGEITWEGNHPNTPGGPTW